MALAKLCKNAEFVGRFICFDNSLRQIFSGQSVIIVTKFTFEREFMMKQLTKEPLKLPLRLPGLRDILPTVLVLLASRANALGMYPFAVAFFAAAYDKNIAYIGILASVIGVATSAGVSAVPKYFLALIIYWLFDKLYRRDNVTVKSVAAGVSVILGGLMVLFIDYNGLFDLFLLLTESLTTILMYIIFTKAMGVTEDFS